MHSTLQRSNHILSLATTYVLILLASISILSYILLPSVSLGKLDIKDVVLQKGRLRRWGAKEEELASLRFDLRADLEPLLRSYNTKQLFLYLTASYEEDSGTTQHDVVLWDRIITRGEFRDIRTVNKTPTRPKHGRKGRGRVNVEEGKNKYIWKNPSGTFRNVVDANLTVHYSLMPYVGLLTSGVAATSQSRITLPEVLSR